MHETTPVRANAQHSQISSPAQAVQQAARLYKSPRLDSYPLPTRLLMATIRMCQQDNNAQSIDRCTLDGIGHMLDASDQRNRTIEAINQFISIVLSQTRFPIEVRHNSCAELSNDEHLVLDIASQLVQGKSHIAERKLQWIMKKPVSSRFIGALDTLSRLDCFKIHGPHAFTPRAFHASPCSAGSALRHQSVTLCEDLSLGERVVLNAIRLWVKSTLMGLCGEAAIRHLSSHLGLHGLDRALHGILRDTAHNATRQFDVRCFCCTETSPDEARMLAALAALSHGKPAESADHLSNWLPQASVQNFLMAATDIRAALCTLKEPLPLRQWNFAELMHRQVLFEQTQSSPSIH